MKKRDLEKARQAFAGNTQLDTEALRQRVREDLGLVSTAHDTADIALTEITKLLRNVAHDDKPTRAVADLARAYDSVVRSIIALRGEARATIAESGTAFASADPPGPRGEGERGAAAPPAKISSPQATFSPAAARPPLALSEFLKQNQGVIDAVYETVTDEGPAEQGEGSPGSPGLPISPGKSDSEGA